MTHLSWRQGISLHFDCFSLFIVLLKYVLCKPNTLMTGSIKVLKTALVLTKLNVNIINLIMIDVSK